MFKLLVIGLILWVTTGFIPTKGFDSEDKTLRKELQKISGVEKPNWKEISIPSTLLASIPLEGKFIFLSPVNANEQKKYIYVGRVNSCRSGGCSNPALTMNLETSEYFDYLIVFDSNLSVQLVKVYNYQATHGHEVTNKGWLKQFQGYDGSRSLTVGKSIDAISGATVSVYSITDDIQDKTKLLKRLIQELSTTVVSSK